MWSISQPGHAPRFSPVDGQGFSALKARTWERSRSILASAGLAASSATTRQSRAAAVNFWLLTDAEMLQNWQGNMGDQLRTTYDPNDPQNCLVDT